MDNLIRKALLGDEQAQEDCTEKGIALPCPYCGKDDCIFVMDCYTAHGDTCDCNSDKKNDLTCVCNYLEGGCGTQIGISRTELEALAKWNTRPAPPIGRCGECKCWQKNGSDWGNCSKWYTEDKVQAFMLEDDFCSSFEPREEE